MLLTPQLVLKRVLDLLLAIPGILVAIPVVGLSALCVWVLNPGPLFFTHWRQGHLGKPFRMWKLRTMLREAPSILEKHLASFPAARAEWESRLCLESDPRLIPVVGKVLRRTSIDELPQLWNVLKGDMSIVGPRPFALEHLASLDATFCRERDSVLPGMTGLWQVRGRGDADMRALRRYDCLYVRKWSLALDVWILFKTIGTVISGKGAY